MQSEISKFADTLKRHCWRNHGEKTYKHNKFENDILIILELSWKMC